MKSSNLVLSVRLDQFNIPQCAASYIMSDILTDDSSRIESQEFGTGTPSTQCAGDLVDVENTHIHTHGTESSSTSSSLLGSTLGMLVAFGLALMLE
jgi:hypothetical protein